MIKNLNIRHPNIGAPDSLTKTICLFLLVCVNVAPTVAQGQISLNKQTEIVIGVTAHRGYSMAYPENTLMALQAGIDIGADWVELDIHQTSDGKIVVIHDKTTGRTGDKDLVVAATTYQDLLDVDVATDFRNRNGLTYEECPIQRIPLLEDALELIMKQGGTRVSIQPKTDCVSDAITIIKQVNATHMVGFNDGNLTFMSTVKHLVPEIPVFWDRPANTNIDEDIEIARKKGFESLVIHHSGVNNEKVQKIKSAGMEAGAWTVNDNDELTRLVRMGIDRIYTDNPELLISILREER